MPPTIKEERLKDKDVQNLEVRDKPYKVYDSLGLYIMVTPSGGKCFRLKHRYAGKEKVLSLGTYPDIGLDEARKMRNEARNLIKLGLDPSSVKQLKKKERIEEQKFLEESQHILKLLFRIGQATRDFMDEQVDRFVNLGIPEHQVVNYIFLETTKRTSPDAMPSTKS